MWSFLGKLELVTTALAKHSGTRGSLRRGIVPNLWKIESMSLNDAIPFRNAMCFNIKAE